MFSPVKKFAILLSLFFLISGAFGQNDSLLRNKKGKIILPQKGYFAIGMSANPVFRFLGNLMSAPGNNSLTLSLIDGRIFGKYFLTAKSALRLGFQIIQINNSLENDIRDDTNLSAGNVLKDQQTNETSGYGIAFGYERRRGSGRMQFVYGGELRYASSVTKQVNTYANAFSVTNQTPSSTTNWSSGTYTRVAQRTIDSRTENTDGLGVRLFAGVEYFFAPQISVGGEVGLGYNPVSKSRVTSKTESWNTFPIPGNTAENPKKVQGTGKALSTDNLSGQIIVMFHFK
jgi:hypothetical protein